MRIINDGLNLFGREQMLSGLGGFLNGNRIGNQNQEEKKPSLGLQLPISQLGFNKDLPSPAELIQKYTTQSPEQSETNETDEETEDNSKEDRVELSDDAEKEVQQAVDNAIRQGVTEKIVVSADGRFEISMDLRVNDDGSYDMDMAVRFAQSQGAALDYLSQGALPESSGSTMPDQMGYSSFEALAERYTSYEQTLETRGFQANIFFEQAKSVALTAEEAYGTDSGERYLSAAKDVSDEFVLNISISGDDITKFNEVGEALTQFDDTGTLDGFLSAVEGVLTTDSSNLGALVDATEGLLNATQEHIGSKLDQFFSSLDEESGSYLEKLGFGSNIFNNLGQDVQKDLDEFFSVTNSILSGLLDNGLIEQQQNSLESQVDVLTEKLDAMREERNNLQNQIGAEENEPILTAEDAESLILKSLDVTKETQGMVRKPMIHKPEAEPIQIDPIDLQPSTAAVNTTNDVVPDTMSNVLS